MKADMSVWGGRTDSEELTPSTRWHEVVKELVPDAPSGGIALLGFACDEGVRRNQGRPGALAGPTAIRRAMANLAYHGEQPVWDAGDVICENDNLEEAQETLGNSIASLLKSDRQVAVLGGGHEIAWGSFQGITQHLTSETGKSQKLGIINFDAHFDLRNPVPSGSSGTPFRQISEWCEQNHWPFTYLVLGINAASNTGALFEYARSQRVQWVEDVVMKQEKLLLARFIGSVDYLYVTVCLDVFPASIAPGVSAPAAVGVAADKVISCLRDIRHLCASLETELILADIAEMNPKFDVDGQTARLAARVLFELLGTTP